MPMADKVYLTAVIARGEGDARFPAIPDERDPASRDGAQDVFSPEFLQYERRKASS